MQFIGGGVNIKPDVNIIPIRPEKGDRLLICSDGVYNAVSDETLLQSLTLSAAAAAEDILGRVLAKGYRNQDNLTAAVLEFREVYSEPDESPVEIPEGKPLRALTAVYNGMGGCDRNEDFVFSGGGTFAVADGLGGHSGGAEAAQAAISCVADSYAKAHDPAGMAELLENANAAVRRLGGGLTTIAAAGLGEGGFTFGNVGDSRVYFFRNGRIIAQTRDHSVCQAAVELGQITKEQIRGNEDRSRLLKVLGSGERLDMKKLPEQIPAKPGDAFLLCTDGFWEHRQTPDRRVLRRNHRT